MSNIRTILWGLAQALITVLFSSAAVAAATQLQRWESSTDGYLDKVALLLLFAVSALVVGGLVLARPAYLILQQRLKEGFVLLVSTTVWLMLMLGAILIVIVFFDVHTIF